MGSMQAFLLSYRKLLKFQLKATRTLYLGGLVADQILKAERQPLNESHILVQDVLPAVRPAREDILRAVHDGGEAGAGRPGQVHHGS